MLKTNFWENLTPLDSSHLEVFLEFFRNFSLFFNSNLNFEFGPVSYRTKPEPGRTGLTGNRFDGLVNLGSGTAVKKQNSGMLTKLLSKVLANQEISMECFISSKFCKERTHGMMMSLF